MSTLPELYTRLNLEPGSAIGVIHLENLTELTVPSPSTSFARRDPVAQNIVSGRGLTLDEVAALFELGGLGVSPTAELATEVQTQMVRRPDGSSDGEHGSCPFCDRIARDEVMHLDAFAASFPDAFPVSDGHTLVVPIRHVTNLDDLNEQQFLALWTTLRDEIARLRRERSPDGFTVGLNIGAAAGQTINHAHVHVIPRYHGDVSDPRGGVRWVIPRRAAYWETT